MSPALAVKQVPLRKIKPLREEYLREANCQIVHNSYHDRGFTDSYALSVDDQVVGYGSLTGPPGERQVIKELFLLPEWRELATRALWQLIETTDATSVETQTNDPLLSVLFWDVAEDVTSDTILFADFRTTALGLPDATFRQLTEPDRSEAFPHTLEPVGEWGVEFEDRIVATGASCFTTTSHTQTSTWRLTRPIEGGVTAATSFKSSSASLARTASRLLPVATVRTSRPG
jgi:hypothetical protein